MTFDNDTLSRQEYRARKIRLASLPRFLIVDPSSRCNAQCRMCYQSFRPKEDRGTDLSVEIFDKLAPVIASAIHINLFATGEPTLSPHLAYFLSETRRRARPDSQIWVSTNGKRISKNIIELLCGRNMGLQFSVDGGTIEVFEKIRRGIRFEQLCNSLRLAGEVRGNGQNPMLSFSCTISKDNIHDIVNIFALAKKYNVGHVLFYEEDPEAPEREPFILDESDRPVFEAQLPAINQMNIPYTNDLYFSGPPSFRRDTTPPPGSNGRFLCTAPWKVFYVCADGTLRTCCTLRDSMGDLNDGTLDEVWNGRQFMKLRRAFVDQKGIPQECARCTDPLRMHDWEDVP